MDDVLAPVLSASQCSSSTFKSSEFEGESLQWVKSVASSSSSSSCITALGALSPLEVDQYSKAKIINIICSRKELITEYLVNITPHNPMKNIQHFWKLRIFDYLKLDSCLTVIQYIDMED